MSPTERATSVDEVIDLLTAWGDDRYDEELGQLAHGLQCAELALRAGSTDELVIASLLHDVGHLLALANGQTYVSGVDDHHEATGAAWLSPLLPPAVTGPVAAHVRAKRYLAAVEPGYLEALSPASLRSLEVQGGPLDDDEASAFARRPGAIDAIALRRWDDLGKVPGLQVTPLADHVERLRRVVRRSTRGPLAASYDS